MRTPQLPDNEDERLAAVYRLKILDSLPEDRFDRLTRIVSKMFNTPMAFISVIDRDRQWFKSCIGLSASETSRDVSICGHAINSTDLLIVRDTLRDDRFFDNESLLKANIRFYVGCPVQAFGVNIGTACIADTKPRDFSESDQRLMHDYGFLVEAELKRTMELAIEDTLDSIRVLTR